MFIHLDLDCFFVSAHRTIDSSLLHIPVAVGGRSNLNIFSSKKEIRKISSNEGAFVSSILTNEGQKTFKEYFVDENGKIRGIITTSSYEARAYGVKTAMSVNEALTLCPELKMLPPNYPLYHELSQKLKELLIKEIPLVEQFSIDEFFGDLSGYIEEDEVVEFAYNIKNKIQEELGLPISIGIANTKYLSKLITEYAKPDGVKYVNKDNIGNFIRNIPISEFPGIGKAFQERLKGYGVKTLGDIKNKRELFYSWKKPGIDLYNRVCGIRDNKLTTFREKKSIGIGRTFDCIYDRNELRRRVAILSRYLCFLVKKSKVNPLTYALKIKYESNQKSKNYINVNTIFNELDFKNHMMELFSNNDTHPSHGVVQLSITVSNFARANEFTYNLFEYEQDSKKSKLTNQMQKLRDKYGIDIIKTAFEIKDEKNDKKS
ncbi:DNA polymerase IV [Poseidonibacter lekithochrous]|uniref:Y-family DNA polymerase n=1 Tax=Poseidonibacter TaxID=2321187 RepID=UPI001C089640|nr:MULTISPECIES: DNA polymerase IV [Poseidonibacter]MBU3016031.1 DNA polymerase IV [Poseidonibacter lekithochrous]MDO6829330.1 DNA polymerase IV [Poseidonibacter sp. 1_MG-2023]